MTASVKHKFVSAIADASDATLVRPTNWNDEHDVAGLALEAPSDGLEYVRINATWVPNTALRLNDGTYLRLNDGTYLLGN